jgi:hypothetical protein
MIYLGVMLIFMITYILNNKKDSLCVLCKNAETAVNKIDINAKILEIEKLF